MQSSQQLVSAAEQSSTTETHTGKTESTSTTATKVNLSTQKTDFQKPIVKAKDLKQIATIYSDCAIRFAMSETCNVLHDFGTNTLANSNWFIRHVFTARGLMKSTSEPLKDQSLHGAITGFLKNKREALKEKNAEISQSVEFLFELLYQTLVFIERDVTEPIPRKNQYLIVLEICNKLKVSSYNISSLKNQDDVRERIAEIEKMLRNKVAELSRQNEGEKIRDSIRSIACTGKIILDNTQRIILRYTFCDEIPDDLGLLSHDERFLNPNLEYVHFKDDGKVDKKTRKFVNSREKLEYMLRVYSADLTSLRSQIEEASNAADQSTLVRRIEDGKQRQGELIHKSTFGTGEVITQHDILKYTSTPEIEKLREQYQQTLIASEQKSKQLVESSSLSLLTKELNQLLDERTTSPANKEIIHKFREHLQQGLLLLATLKSSLEIIQSIEKIVRDTGNLAPVLCFGPLNDAADIAQKVFCDVSELLIDLREESSEVKGFCKAAGKQWKKNIDEAHDLTYSTLAQIHQGIEHIGDFRKAITTENIIKNLNRMDRTFRVLYNQLILQGRLPQLSPFSVMPRMIAQQLSKLQQEEKQALEQVRDSRHTLLGGPSQRGLTQPIPPSTLTVEDVTHAETKKEPKQSDDDLTKFLRLDKTKEEMKITLVDFLNAKFQNKTIQQGKEITITQLFNVSISSMPIEHTVANGEKQYTKKYYPVLLQQKEVVFIEESLKAIIIQVRQRMSGTEQTDTINHNGMTKLPNNGVIIECSDILSIGKLKTLTSLLLNAKTKIEPKKIGNNTYFEANVMDFSGGEENAQTKAVLIEQRLVDIFNQIKGVTPKKDTAEAEKKLLQEQQDAQEKQRQLKEKEEKEKEANPKETNSKPSEAEEQEKLRHQKEREELQKQKEELEKQKQFLNQQQEQLRVQIEKENEERERKRLEKERKTQQQLQEEQSKYENKIAALEKTDEDIATKLSARFTVNELTAFTEAKKAMQTSRRTYMMSEQDEDCFNVYESAVVKCKAEITKITNSIDRAQDFTRQVLTFKSWMPIVWLTGIGAVIHAILAIGSALYRGLNQENIRRDEILLSHLNTYANDLVATKQDDATTSLSQPKGINDPDLLAFKQNLPSEPGRVSKLGNFSDTSSVEESTVHQTTNNPVDIAKLS